LEPISRKQTVGGVAQQNIVGGIPGKIRNPLELALVPYLAPLKDRFHFTQTLVGKQIETESMIRENLVRSSFPGRVGMSIQPLMAARLSAGCVTTSTLPIGNSTNTSTVAMNYGLWVSAKGWPVA